MHTPPPPAHTPLVALPVLVVDTETTGLDVRTDRIVQIGAVAMQGTRILDTPRIDQLVNPGIAIAPSSTRIHGLDDAAVAEAPYFADAVGPLREAVAGRVVVGHHVSFDLAVLHHEAARAGMDWDRPPALDLPQVVGALVPTLPDLDLDSVARAFGVTVHGRHTAIGDCLATACIWAQVIERLHQSGIRTLGEARHFAARRADVAMARQHAGWDAQPGESEAPAPAASALPRVDAHAFQRRVEELMSTPPAWISPGATLREAAEAMVERGIGSLLVGDAESPPEGIITERDLLRRIADSGNAFDTTGVREAMSVPVAAMHGDEMLYRALARMDRLGIRHLAVLDGAGRAAGMVSQRDLLHHRARAAEILGDALVEAQSGAELAAAYARVPDVARRLVHEGLAGAEVARVVTSELRALTARAAELSIEAMREAGEGEPPARWCLMVLGSGGRGESLLGADQDNALIHDGSIDDDNWFERFGARLNEMLDLAGLPLCTGEIMVRTAQWRGNRAQWRERVEGWLDSGRPRDLLNVDVFFDLVAVAGDAELARELHDQAVRAASESPPFMALLADYTVRLAPRMALFGRLRVEDDRFNAKRDGLLPLVSTARTLAVRIGSRIVATPERLRAAQVAGRMSEGDCEALLTLHDRLLGLVLHQQLEDLAEGRRASGKIAMSSLSRGERRELARLIRHLDSVVGSLRSAVSPGS